MKLDRLAVLVPSRNRPENISRLIKAWIETKATAQLIVCVDDDDPKLLDYVKTEVTGEGPFEIRIAERMRLGPTLNHWANIYARQYAYIGFFGDDHVPRTVGWDEVFLTELRKQSGTLVYGNDLFQGACIPTAIAMCSRIVDVLGYMHPPKLIHMCIDSFWKELGIEIGRLTYLPDIVIEHMHPYAGKAESDSGYAEVNLQSQYDSDTGLLEEYRHVQFQADILKLREAGITNEATMIRSSASHDHERQE